MPAVDEEHDVIVIVEHDLEKEFFPQIPRIVLYRIAEEEVASFHDAHVGDYVKVLAWRRARRRARVMADSSAP